jgi:methylmalonyl-CoA mutase cobalamin-binding domain/chain
MDNSPCGVLNKFEEGDENMTDHSLLVTSISDLDAKTALEQVKTRLRQAEDPQIILTECRQGMEEVGRKFETGEYYIADLMYVANIFQRIMEILKPELEKTMSLKSEGKVLIATVKNDIHDIGKNLVASMLNASGFEMIDLGIDVSPDLICSNIREHSPDIVALSCLLTSTMDSIENTISEIMKADLRDRVKIIVGGNPLTPESATAMGADAYGDDAREAVLRCKELMGG